ncbi:Phosphoenolpyruvate-protein phosphotransferase [Methyloligella halotolerans]|uniref:phosphoenolpyruvate--protein phosphotransferase n=1 Tax=Methyloligella halotolerans TaxID=1177755 RepID=A0A1E2RYP9_9HYPH|nr:phosphoenolpyruvate--protein phosphotransferase [Methyloligella halotolerans]ODA67344.1 Phosphoenolpyruvate-protein phosphotransferase [Methyloligella halotolerans]
MALSVSAPRQLLRRLREVMAEPESTQARLDKVVVLIASNMVAEVCSLYLRRRDDSLELVATEGLAERAVHSTHLKRGEGLVGLIAQEAEAMQFPDAQNHPAYSYRPETGEEIYHSFVGVPILRGGHAIGVLTVQNRTHRQYTDEEVEALQTTAMVLAEMLASGGMLANDDVGPGERDDALRMQVLPLSEGVALGHVVLHEPPVMVTKLIAEDADLEQRRLDQAIDDLTGMIDAMLERGDMARAGEHREVLEAFRMFADDRGWRRRLEEALHTGLTAEAAVQRVRNDTRARMLRQTDAHSRDRLHDIDDLSNRLLRLLSGGTGTAASGNLPHDSILIARNMGPAELLDYDREKLRGLVLVEGGSGSHVAIVARALGIAAVSQAKGILESVEAGDAAIVDADGGELHVRPTQEVVQAYSDKVRFRARRQAQYAALRSVPAVTLDEEKISLNINAGLLFDLPHLEESGADGIGLFRTELQFMISSTFPRLDQQTRMYKAIFDAAGGKPVVFRTLDVGGDKVLPYFQAVKEENPALGWRAIRMALDRPALFRTQIRALMRGAAGRELRILLPMIADVSELTEAKSFITKELQILKRHGKQEPSRLLIGAMVEVPSLLWQLDELMPLVDFVSVGSNDLMQFMFAADRSNEKVAGRFDNLNRAGLRALRSVVLAGKRHEVPITLCGEMAGKPLEAMALIGLGFRSISMAPASVGPVKAMILSLDVGETSQKLLTLLDEDSGELRDQLQAFAVEKGVQV